MVESFLVLRESAMAADEWMAIRRRKDGKKRDDESFSALPGRKGRVKVTINPDVVHWRWG